MNGLPLDDQMHTGVVERRSATLAELTPGKRPGSDARARGPRPSARGRGPRLTQARTRGASYFTTCCVAPHRPLGMPAHRLGSQRGALGAYRKNHIYKMIKK